MITFEGQAAIVTGAGSGIGRETALLLASRGARIIVNDPGANGEGQSLAAIVVGEIKAAGGQAVAEMSAVGSREAAATIATAALDHFGRIDILVNNAGIGRPAQFGEGSDEDIDLVFAVNLLGPYALMRAVWPVMRRQRYGRILNTTSSGAFGTGSSGAYAPTKAGVIGLTKEAAISGREHGILVNALMPIAHTPLLMRHPDPAFRKWAEENFPARLVAATSTFLVSADLAESGEIFASGGGLVQRVAFYETGGFLDKQLTPEAVRDNLEQIMILDGGEVIVSQADHGRLTIYHFPR